MQEDKMTDGQIKRDDWNIQTTFKNKRTKTIVSFTQTRKLEEEEAEEKEE